MNGTNSSNKIDVVDAQPRRQPDSLRPPTPTPLPPTSPTMPPPPPQSTDAPTPAPTTAEYSYEYNMRHENRGFALIFNNEKFEDPELKKFPRKGTLKDGNDLAETLSLLGFTVKHFPDYKWHEIEREIEKYAREDHSENDCILVAIMSHGELGTIWAKDKKYSLDSIWGPLVKCPSLVGKPKLFFIQACQGHDVDHGITLEDSSETDGGGGAAIASGVDANYKEDETDVFPTGGGSVTGYAIPTHSDILIAYSTIPGFYSWRNEGKGSWFMQSLCAELKEKGKAAGYDLLTLLTFVIQRVAMGYESNCTDPKYKHLDMKKQTPCVTHLLTHLVYFRDKIPQ